VGAIEIGGMSYFPSPLLQALLEGIILTGIMLYFWRRDQKTPRKTQNGKLSGIFLIGYVTARIIAEQFRLPDAHIGYLFATEWLTLGILYSVPMFLVGMTLLLQKKSH
jgi:phosphatidylglycerol---prolipoprotein diacylglyceryl transferase